MQQLIGLLKIYEMHFDKGTKLLDVDAIKYTASMVKESYVQLNSTIR